MILTNKHYPPTNLIQDQNKTLVKLKAGREDVAQSTRMNNERLKRIIWTACKTFSSNGCKKAWKK
jgi:hypothetical protein